MSPQLGARLPGPGSHAAASGTDRLGRSGQSGKQEAAGGAHMEAAALGRIAALCRPRDTMIDVTSVQQSTNAQQP